MGWYKCTTAASNCQDYAKGDGVGMTTPEKIRTDAAKLDAYLEAFEKTYLYFVDIGEGEWEQRNRCVFAFYELRDKLIELMAEMEEFAGHMEVCNAVFAANLYRKDGKA
jgi:hypothetical protein